MKILEELVIDFFANLRLNVFIYYVVSVTIFLGVLYYFTNVVKLDVYVVFSLLFLLTLLSGFFLTKLATAPLLEYILELQHLSKETLHELKLPLSTILTNLGMIKRKTTEQKTLQRLKRIEDACGMIESRYNELDYMIKKQSTNEIKEEFFLDELLQERITFFEHIYPEFSFELQTQKTAVVYDKIGFSKVIDNLIDNGIKYSNKEKKITVILKQNQLSIIDYGVGIEEVELLKIFDRYYQSNQNIEGFGIGLSMVKRFCDKNKIQLTVQSKVGVGTTILLQFKRKEQ